MAETGTLTDKPAPEIFREMAARERDGVLRIASDKKIRVVVFEKGRPIYAISNVPDDQLDLILLRQRKITREQSSLVRRQVQKEPDIGPKLVELGIVDETTLEATKVEQIIRIVQNAMLSREGEFMLDLAARVAHEISIDAPVEQWLLDTARNVTAEVARALLGGAGTLYSRTEREIAEMSPLDSFILSRVTDQMTVEDIRTRADLSVDDGLPVIYALFASGLLTRSGGSGGSTPTTEPAIKEKSIDEIRAELDQMLSTFRQVDHYDVLQTTRRADSTEIKRAYYALAKQYHPDRYRHASDPEVREKLEAVFAQISRAYDTLKDEKLRTDYDRRIGAGSPTAPPPLPPPVTSRPAPIRTSQPLSGGSVPSRPVSPPPAFVEQGNTGPIGEPSARDAAPPPPSASQPPLDPSSASPAQLAERSFHDGLHAYQNRDVMRAVHLFREAVRFAPDKGTYHLHLGVALSTNPRWYKEAEKHLLEASRTDPMNLQIFLKLGQIYQEGGLKKRAESQYRAALGIDPSNRIAKRALADMGLAVPAGPAGKSSGGDTGGGLLSKFFKKK